MLQNNILKLSLTGDLETPISAALKLGIADRPNSFLFESVEDGERRGRYSLIGLAPDLIWKVRENVAEITTKNGTVKDELPVLESLRALIKASQFELPDGLPSIAAGVYGYLGYDMVRFMETLPKPNKDVLGLPDAIFIRPSRMVLFDSVKDEMVLLASINENNDKAQAEAALEEMKSLLSSPLIYSEKKAEASQVNTSSNMAKEEFYQATKKVIKYIEEGDIYQAVISQRFETPFNLPPFSFYRSLRAINPSPYLYFMNFGEFNIAGSSPEVLVRLNEGKITIRPIAGTTPRPEKNSNNTEKTAGENLLSDPKERAEHLMLLDLGRNDVGRISEIGSVNVTQSFALQWTSHLIHIVSNVEGKLDKKYDALDALIAGFPAGTVSGAPKIRAIEIIDELENEKRGTYAGALGYFSSNGDMDSCIILRTAIIKNEVLYVQTGGGVVADSIPEYEYKESVNKAKALHVAASLAHEFAPLPRKGP